MPKNPNTARTELRGSAAVFKHFLRFSLFLVGRLRSPHSNADNLNSSTANGHHQPDLNRRRQIHEDNKNKEAL